MPSISVTNLIPWTQKSAQKDTMDAKKHAKSYLVMDQNAALLMFSAVVAAQMSPLGGLCCRCCPNTAAWWSLSPLMWTSRLSFASNRCSICVIDSYNEIQTTKRLLLQPPSLLSRHAFYLCHKFDTMDAKKRAKRYHGRKKARKKLLGYGSKCCPIDVLCRRCCPNVAAWWSLLSLLPMNGRLVVSVVVAVDKLAALFPPTDARFA
jgi:hypothetical protein